LVRNIEARVLGCDVYALVFRGPRGLWPAIFERLNTAGTPLSRFDVFAALWEDIRVVEHEVSEEIRDEVRKQYEELESHGLEFDSDVSSDASISLIEFLSAFGEQLAVTFPNLLEPPGGSRAGMSSILALVNVLHGLRTSEMHLLPSKMAVDGEGRVHVAALQASIETACRDLEKMINPVANLEIRTTPRARRKEVPYSMNQVVSILARLILARFERGSWLPRDSDEARLESRSVLRNAPWYLLSDVVRGLWSGHGDSRLFQTVWGERIDGVGVVASDHYLNEFTQSEMLKHLDDWHSELMKKGHSSRSVSAVDRLILRHIHVNGSFLTHETHALEIEHIYPIAGLKNRAEIEDVGKWPINAISNLALLPKSTNRNKTDKTVSQFLRHCTPTQAGHTREAVLMPNCEKLDWSFGVKSGATFTKSAYLKFLESRWRYQKDKIIETLLALEELEN
jgi:hypothetical protein